MLDDVGRYTEYVLAVYLVALLAYGGSTLLWQRQQRKILRHLERMQAEAKKRAAGGRD